MSSVHTAGTSDNVLADPTEADEVDTAQEAEIEAARIARASIDGLAASPPDFDLAKSKEYFPTERSVSERYVSSVVENTGAEGRKLKKHEDGGSAISAVDLSDIWDGALDRDFIVKLTKKVRGNVSQRAWARAHNADYRVLQKIEAGAVPLERCIRVLEEDYGVVVGQPPVVLNRDSD